MVAAALTFPTPSPQRIRGELRLSRERMSRLLDVSAKTIERWEANDALPANRATRARLEQIQQIIELGNIVYTPEGFQAFLTTKQPRFAGATALQLIERGEADAVYAALCGDYEGLGY